MKLSKWIALFAVMCLLFTACGEAEQNAESESGISGVEQQTVSSVYTLNRQKLPDANDALRQMMAENGSCLIEQCAFIQNTVYRCVRLTDSEGYISGYCIQTLPAPYNEWTTQELKPEEWMENSENAYISRVFPSENGGFFLLLYSPEADGTYYWAEWSEETTKPTLIQINGNILNEDFILNTREWYIDKNATSYCWTDTDLNIYNADFSSEENGNASIQGGILQMFSDGDKTYQFGNDAERGLYIRDVESGENVYSQVQLTVGSYGNAGIIPISSKEAYLYNTGMLYKLSFEDSSFETMMEYSLDRVLGGGIMENGLPILLAEKDGETVLYALSQSQKDGQTTAKQTIELAMCGDDLNFKELVVEFNQQNPDYEIVMIMPERGTAEYAAWKTRLQADVSKGEGPDVIHSFLMPLSEGVGKGYFKDVTEWFAQDRDRIWAAAWEQGEVDGRSYAVPYDCIVRTLVTGEQFADGLDTWNMEQLGQVYEKSGCQAVMACADWSWGEDAPMYMLSHMGGCGKMQTNLIDWENGFSHLNEEKTAELLEFIKENQYTGAENTEGEAIATGKVMTCYKSIFNVYSILDANALFQDKEVYIGFPVESGRSGSFLSSESFFVNQATTKEEGVKAFLDYLLSDEVQEKMAREAGKGTGTAFPVDKDAFDKACEELLKAVNEEHPITREVLGYDYVEMPLTEESVEKVHMLFETAVSKQDNGEISNILFEESKQFFTGTKTVQEVCNTMHNRVQLYLDEQN